MKPVSHTVISRVILSIGALFGLWAAAAMTSGLLQAGSLSSLVRHYMTASGLVTPLHTLVDFYTHIKGVEYLICVAFFAVFPAFYRYVNREKTTLRVKG